MHYNFYGNFLILHYYLKSNNIGIEELIELGTKTNTASHVEFYCLRFDVWFDISTMSVFCTTCVSKTTAVSCVCV